jgi:hypothetical protein
MAGITLQIAEERLAFWLDIESQLTAAESVTRGGYTYSARNSTTIKENVDYWNNKCKELAQLESRVPRARRLEMRG